MILGVDWVKQFSPLVFDFIYSTITFYYEDLIIVLKDDDKEQGKLASLPESTSRKLLSREQQIEGGAVFLVMGPKDSAIAESVEQNA